MNQYILVFESKYKLMKAQFGIIEYIVISIFLVIIIAGVVIFLSYWQAAQIGLEKRTVLTEKVLSLTKEIFDHPALIKENVMFDDSKLDRSKLEKICKNLEEKFDVEWFAEIKAFEIVKTGEKFSFIDSMKMDLCEKKDEEDKKFVAYDFPVNVYRKKEKVTQMGILKVGVYFD
jgi:hypothetical protein